MPAKLSLRDQEFEVRPGMTVRDALMKIGILPETVLATRDGELLTEDVIVRESDHIILIAVISGG
jgi:sulfur carrier protein ThiS